MAGFKFCIDLVMANILVVNGPNLNLLGEREPEVYGNTTLEQVNQRLEQIAETHGHQLQTMQSNAEHQLVECIQAARQQAVDFIIINPAAFTHTSVALRDALIAVEIPFIEVHLSNVQGREQFRHHSYLSDIASGVISGLGPQGYELALQAVISKLENS